MTNPAKEYRRALRNAGLSIDDGVKFLRVDRSSFYRWVKEECAPSQLHAAVMAALTAIINELIEEGRIKPEGPNRKVSSYAALRNELQERGYYEWFGGV